LELKDRILLAAETLCRRVGCRAMTLDQLSSQLGISKKTIYQNFEDKDALIDAVMDQEISKSQQDCNHIAAKSLNPIHEMVLMMECFNQDIKDLNPILLHDLFKYYPKTYAKFDEYKRVFILSIISSNLKRGVEEGLYRSDINIDVLSRYRLESSLFIFNEELFPMENYRREDLVNIMLENFLYGIATDKGKELYNKYKFNTIK
jgi:TetR/AcrR family transcriptional regulator, cholesterol catabolism regulator